MTTAAQATSRHQTPRLVRSEPSLAQPIRESAMRIARRAIGPQSVRWIQAFIMLELGLDAGEQLPDGLRLVLEPIALDQYVRRAIAAMDAETEERCELLARNYGL